MTSDADMIARVSPHFGPDAPVAVVAAIRSLLSEIINRGIGISKSVTARLVPVLMQTGYEPRWVADYLRAHQTPVDEGISEIATEWLQFRLRLVPDSDNADEIRKWVKTGYRSKLPEAIFWELFTGSELVPDTDDLGSLMKQGIVREATEAERIGAHCTVPELRELCGQLQVKKSGNKGDLIARLAHVARDILRQACPELLIGKAYINNLTPLGKQVFVAEIDWLEAVSFVWVHSEIMYYYAQHSLQDYRETDMTYVEILGSGAGCDICKQKCRQYPIASVPELPLHPGCRCCYAPVV